IGLSPAVTRIDEAVISAVRSDRNISAPQMGVEKIDLGVIDKIPVFFGEKDILKSVQLLPGISSASEGSTGYSVRGGSPGENLILLDEAPVYSSSHLLGFFSVFNSDAINDATMYKGAIPAEFGSRAASVMNISMNNGNNRRFGAKGGIGIVASRLSVEGPIAKNKSSYIISGRRTYADLVARTVLPDNIISKDTKFYFYDLNAKFNFILNNRNRLFFSGFFGKDLFQLGDNIGTGWENITGTVRWNHLFSDKIFSNTSVIYSKYDYGFIFGNSSLRLRSGIEDIGLKEKISWFINPENTIKLGFDITYHRFSPGEISSNDLVNYQLIRKEKQALEASVFIQNEQEINSVLSANYGIRFSAFSQTGPGWFYEYDGGDMPVDSVFFERGEFAYPGYAIEPRLSLSIKTGAGSSLKLSYNRISQYLHLLSNTTSGSPTDVWMPSGNKISALLTDHLSAGYFMNFSENNIETSVELYYKNITNASDYKDGADIVFNEYLESQVLSGRGRGYGLELYLKKKSGNYTGWISYTLSRTENKIEGISNNNWYPVRYDRTHDLALVNLLSLSKRLDLSCTWIYSTGNAVTFPGGMYLVNNNPVPWYTERNGYRMPPYHRLDINLRLAGKERKRFTSAWDFSVYNLYNRRNAYMITFRESETKPGDTEAVRLSLFGIVPSITWKFSF
ncbi:MAG: TonB-dependent receptor plug domain-containing protein, partial [Marinilabiliaceae bacterium]|nr:TonB-dependent receptor plug domain-containing protein [Marinilabiliaceae bacterium]